MPTQKEYFVRLTPYDKKRGLLCMNYMYKGVRFNTQWKRVSASHAKELELLRQPHDVALELPLFQVRSPMDALDTVLTEEDISERAGKRKLSSAEAVPDASFREDQTSSAPAVVEAALFDEAAFTADDDAEDVPVEPAPKITRKTPNRARSRK